MGGKGLSLAKRLYAASPGRPIKNDWGGDVTEKVAVGWHAVSSCSTIDLTDG